MSGRGNIAGWGLPGSSRALLQYDGERDRTSFRSGHPEPVFATPFRYELQYSNTASPKTGDPAEAGRQGKIRTAGPNLHVSVLRGEFDPVDPLAFQIQTDSFQWREVELVNDYVDAVVGPGLSRGCRPASSNRVGRGPAGARWPGVTMRFVGRDPEHSTAGAVTGGKHYRL